MNMPDASTIMVIGLVMLTLFLLMRSARKGQKPQLTRSVNMDMNARQNDRVRQEISELLIELEEFKREYLGKIDTRIKTLNELILQADQRIQELKKLESSKPAAAKDTPKKEELANNITNPMHKKVIELAGMGMTPDEISAATGLKKGEIELILGLAGLK